LSIVSVARARSGPGREVVEPWSFRGSVFSRFCDFADFRFCVKPGLRDGAHALLHLCDSAHRYERVNPVPCFSGFAESRIAGFTILRTSGGERQ
jgi:hypothetical protein